VNKLIDFIHVGDYKTGTSWLQEVVFPFHHEIQYLGDHFEKRELQEVLRELVDIRDLDFDAESLRKKFEQNFTKEDSKVIGISREALSQSNYITGEHAKRNAQRLKEVFGDVKIIYVIREQISMLGSIYSQYLKMGGTRSFNDWFLDPIECKGIIERLKYDKNIAMYQEVFGKENIKVLLFEELRANKNSFLTKLYSFIGCQDTSFQPIESKKEVNTSLTTHGALVSKVLHRLFRNSYHNYRSTFLGIDKLIYFFLPQKIIDKRDELSQGYVLPNYGELDKKQRVLYSINMGIMGKLTKFCEKIKTGKKIKVPSEIAEKILPLFKESNQKLKDKYHLDVDKYGWSL